MAAKSIVVTTLIVTRRPRNDHERKLAIGMDWMNTLRKNILLIFVLAVIMPGCRAAQTPAPCPDYGVETPIDGLPDYLSKVWPYPDSEVTLQCYEDTITPQEYYSDIEGRGVGVRIVVARIDTFLTGNDPVEDERFDLYVDDTLVSKKSLIVHDPLLRLEYINPDDPYGGVTETSKSTGYSLSWAPDLSPGLHEARIEITRDNGELLQYEWSFTITDP